MEQLSLMLPNQDEKVAYGMEGYRDGFANGNKSVSISGQIQDNPFFTSYLQYENSLHRTQESSAAIESNHVRKPNSHNESCGT
jgi:hypothetical protein